MKAIIIDDERNARNLIKTILRDAYNDDIELYEASDLAEGVKLIKEYEPSVVYLDIKMPGESGLQLLNYFEEDTINFNIIFTTAYSEYAIDAFKLFAIDFLLKPINPLELIEATENASKKHERNNIADRLQKLETHLSQISKDRIMLEVPKGFKFVNFKDIIYFEADGMYTRVHLTSGKTETIAKPLKHFIAQLDNNPNFYKPHRSFFINLQFIAEVKKGDGLYAVMENRRIVHISRDKKHEFLKLLDIIFR